MITTSEIPHEVNRVTSTLAEAGFDAYLVGGCVRDLIMNKTPKDWDITTNARPDDIQALFSHTFYENEYGTVGVVHEETNDPRLEVIEVTPYRTEYGYSDKRRPDSVSFSDSLEDDLKRRDFTVNALAYNIQTETLVDTFNGVDDITQGILRTVGDPHLRFNEDALRLLRAVRIAAEHGFAIQKETEEALMEHVVHMKHVAVERIRDEFTRIIESPAPSTALMLCRTYNLIPFIIPELEELYDIEQGGVHIHDAWEHSARALQAAADKDFSFHVKLAALFHDLGKPRSRRPGEKKAYTFYGHEVVGARMTRDILSRLHYPKETVTRVTTLVRWHMFFSDPDEITKSAVRRLINNIGKEYIWDLINLRICDRISMGRPKEEPYRLRKYQALVEEVLTDPVSVTQLKIDGDALQDMLHMKPGPRIGFILHALLEDVLEDPCRNTEEYLHKKAQELNEYSDEHLKKQGERGKYKLKEAEEQQQQAIRAKYHVE